MLLLLQWAVITSEALESYGQTLENNDSWVYHFWVFWYIWENKGGTILKMEAMKVCCGLLRLWHVLCSYEHTEALTDSHNFYKNLYVEWELAEWVKVPAIMPSTKGCILRTFMDKGKKRLLQVFFRTASMRREWATLDSTKIPFRTYN